MVPHVVKSGERTHEVSTPLQPTCNEDTIRSFTPFAFSQARLMPVRGAYGSLRAIVQWDTAAVVFVDFSFDLYGP